MGRQGTLVQDIGTPTIRVSDGLSGLATACRCRYDIGPAGHTLVQWSQRGLKRYHRVSIFPTEMMAQICHLRLIYKERSEYITNMRNLCHHFQISEQGSSTS